MILKNLVRSKSLQLRSSQILDYLVKFRPKGDLGIVPRDLTNTIDVFNQSNISVLQRLITIQGVSDSFKCLPVRL